MQKVETSPDEHLRSLDESVRDDMVALDREISKVMEGCSRTLWRGVFWGGSDQAIIGYGDYVYRRPKGPETEWFVVGLALQKNYISVYVNAVEEGEYLTTAYADRLGKVKVGKSSIGFKRLADVELDVLLELVGRAKKLMAP